MKITKVRFSKNERPEFYKVLNQRVNNYFRENKLSKKANLDMKFKTAFMLTLYFAPFGFIYLDCIHSFATLMMSYLVMGLGMSGIALSVMHDANHGAYSEDKRINNALGYLLNFIGGYHVTWKVQHNVLHHSYTNIHGHDEDLNQNVMRFSPDQARKSFFKYQAYYATFLYALLTINRFLVKDILQLIRYHRNHLLTQHTFLFYLVELIITKLLYLYFVLILPIMTLDFPAYQILIAFFVMHFLTSLILALIFQPAHILEETDFYVPGENNSMENDWVIHEMRTTSNFARKGKIFSWFIGGLNYQIEHHLFPHICHIHYKSIAIILKVTAEEYKIPYNQHTTFYDALKSHYTMLDKLGTGEYDREKKLNAKPILT